MTFLPIVERELRVAARSKRTHRSRLAAASLALALAILTGPFWLSISPGGQPLFYTLSIFGVVFCLLDGLHATADCISSEKREGTLGLLFLTDLTGFDVVLGKLASTTLRSLYGLLATFPVLGLSLLLGGVTAGQFWAMVAALITILVLSQSVAVCVSSMAWKENAAVSSTATLLAGLVLGPMLPTWIGSISGSRFSFGIEVFSSYTLFRSALTAGGRDHRFIESLVINLAMAGFFLALAGFRVRRQWQIRPTANVASTAAARRRVADEPRRRRLLEMNPILWLALRFHRPWLDWGPLFVFCCVALVSVKLGPEGFLMLCVVVGWGLNLMVKLHLAGECARIGAGLRLDQQLDLLLTTPLGPERIREGLVGAVRSLIVPVGPTLLFVEFLCIAAGATAAHRTSPNSDGREIVLFATAYLSLTLLDFHAFANTALWFGFSTGKASAAVNRTQLRLILLPIVLAPFCLGLMSWLGFFSLFGVSLISLVWSQNRLKSQFVAIATRPDAFGRGTPVETLTG